MKKVLIVIALVILLLLGGCAKESVYVETELMVQSGLVSAVGEAVFVQQDGTVQKVSGDTYKAARTKDRQHTIVLEKDGTLSVLTGENKSIIADDVFDFYRLTDEATLFVQLEEEGKYIRPGDYSYNSSKATRTYVYYSFATGDKHTMNNVDDYILSSNGSALLYVAWNENSEKDELRLLKPGENAAEVVLATESNLWSLGVSSDGSTYAWCEEGENECAVYIYANGERQKALSVKDDNAYFDMYFNEEESFAVIAGDGDTVAVWTAEGGVTKTRLPNELSDMVATERGDFAVYPNVNAGTIYVSTYEGDTENLYSVTMDGTREKIANCVRESQIVFGHLYYIDEDDALYTAELSDGNLTNETKIADGVADFNISPDGKAVVYARDVGEDSVGALYYYTAGLEKPVRISSESYCYAYYYSYSKYRVYNLYAQFTSDGSNILYFNDADKIEGSSTRTATLMQYNIESAESTRIGSDILTAIRGDVVGGYPMTDNFTYYKHATNDEELGVLCDLMYWNGETATTLVNDIDY